MNSTSNAVKVWKETFKGFIKVKAFVVFSYGSIVVFEDSPVTEEMTKSLALTQLQNVSNKDHFTSLRTKDGNTIVGWNEKVLTLVCPQANKNGSTLVIQNMSNIFFFLKGNLF